jgi:hypothetical protein
MQRIDKEIGISFTREAPIPSVMSALAITHGTRPVLAP